MTAGVPNRIAHATLPEVPLPVSWAGLMSSFHPALCAALRAALSPVAPMSVLLDCHDVRRGVQEDPLEGSPTGDVDREEGELLVVWGSGDAGLPWSGGLAWGDPQAATWARS